MIDEIAAAIGDRARARMLVALMGGTALTATELAIEAEVSASTASFHLARLVDAELIAIRKQGRHRYYRLVDAEVADMIEGMMVIVFEDQVIRRQQLWPDVFLNLRIGRHDGARAVGSAHG